MSRKRKLTKKYLLKRKNKIKNIIWVFCTIICFIVLFFCIYKIVVTKIDENTNNNNIETVNDIIDGVEIGTDPDVDDYKTNYYEIYKGTKLSKVKFNKLKDINKETIGFLSVSNTNINYPIVKHSDNTYYLNHSFDKTKSGAGWLFMDYRNNLSVLDKNTIIYGHNLAGGTMFGDLDKVLSSNWYKNPNNQTITFLTDSQKYNFKIFSIYNIPTENYYITTDFSTTEDYNYFINTLLKRSVYNFKQAVTTKDKILTLSTCSGKTNRIVVHAVLIN